MTRLHGLGYLKTSERGAVQCVRAEKRIRPERVDVTHMRICSVSVNTLRDTIYFVQKVERRHVED